MIPFDTEVVRLTITLQHVSGLISVVGLVAYLFIFLERGKSHLILQITTARGDSSGKSYDISIFRLMQTVFFGYFIFITSLVVGIEFGFRYGIASILLWAVMYTGIRVGYTVAIQDVGDYA